MIHSVLPEINRRNFIGRAFVALGGFSAIHLGAGFLTGCSTKGNPLSSSAPAAPAVEVPENLSWQTVLVSKDEPGEPLVVSGRIFQADGQTPAVGTTLYVYHTDARGLYSEEDGKGGEPKPRLKGWMRTDREGRYEFRTIKPASYPGGGNPRHIHAKIYETGRPEQWPDTFVFNDDPLITPQVHVQYDALGKFSPIMVSKLGGDGVIRCVHDIRLKQT
ncbi:MAG: protocatechuate 3,4-dioxygenase [Acidobacteria bacterium]|nr:protocatechuate 3,4-dioxygenase [Acidobacteriota bacterium]